MSFRNDQEIRDQAAGDPDEQLKRACADYLENKIQQAEVGPERSAILALDMDSHDIFTFISKTYPQTMEGAKARQEILARKDSPTSSPFHDVDVALYCLEGALDAFEDQIYLEQVQLSDEARYLLDLLRCNFRAAKRPSERTVRDGRHRQTAVPLLATKRMSHGPFQTGSDGRQGQRAVIGRFLRRPAGPASSFWALCRSGGISRFPAFRIAVHYTRTGPCVAAD